MIVTADAGPLHYLVLIEAIDIVPSLYGHVLVPQTVIEELNKAETPNVVRSWATQPPRWCEILPDLPFDPTLASLDPGERAAITLALSVRADRLLIDDWEGRVAAIRRSLFVVGTLGILIESHKQGLLDFETALVRLLQTNFYLSTELINRVRQELFTAGKKRQV